LLKNHPKIQKISKIFKVFSLSGPKTDKNRPDGKYQNPYKHWDVGPLKLKVHLDLTLPLPPRNVLPVAETPRKF
jgi:hypothetical protein